MGTRADFYDGLDGPEAWLGSIGWDGYPDGIPLALLEAEDREAFRSGVDAFLDTRRDATRPEMGWPWPWDDSRTTDYAYVWDREAGGLSVYQGGTPVEVLEDPRSPRELTGEPAPEFPDMSDLQAVTFGRRSGLIAVRDGSVVDEL